MYSRRTSEMKRVVMEYRCLRLHEIAFFVNEVACDRMRLPVSAPRERINHKGMTTYPSGPENSRTPTKWGRTCQDSNVARQDGWARHKVMCSHTVTCSHTTPCVHVHTGTCPHTQPRASQAFISVTSSTSASSPPPFDREMRKVSGSGSVCVGST